MYVLASHLLQLYQDVLQNHGGEEPPMGMLKHMHHVFMHLCKVAYMANTFMWAAYFTLQQNYAHLILLQLLFKPYSQYCIINM